MPLHAPAPNNARMSRRRAIDIAAMLSVVEAAPMTRAEIARRTGLARSTVTMLANGERGRRPSYDTVKAIETLHATVLQRPLRSPP